ncbi:peptidoglycan-binding protein, partial [Candidatus Woesearchaeota archaeon]|nr:peptidoglycan-binding protein [Candidatus Woesearchaeota archaeon]
IHDFENNPKYGIEIADGTLFLTLGTDKENEKIPFTGSLRMDKNAKATVDGTIAGRKVVGEKLVIKKDGAFTGQITYFEGASFSSAPAMFDGSVLTLNGAELTSLESGTKINVEGKIEYAPKGILQGSLNVPKGKKLDIAGVKIDSTATDVEVPFGSSIISPNVVRIYAFEGASGDVSKTVEMKGNGFTATLSPSALFAKEDKEAVYIPLHQRGYYRMGDSPPDGTPENEAIRRIQEIVGISSPDGKYGPVTTAKVEAWQTAHGLVNDGKFGESSLNAALGSDDTLSVSPNGGSASLTMGKNGLKMKFQGESTFSVGDKEINFDGKNVYSTFISQSLDHQLNVPAEITFLNEEGNQLGGKVRISATKTQFSNIQETDLARACAMSGVSMKSASCAASTSIIFDQQAPTGQKYSWGSPSLSTAAGTVGDGWEMSHNMVERGGKRVFFSEDSLSQEEKQKLGDMRSRMQAEYQTGIQQISVASDSPEYQQKKTELIKSISERYREEEGQILNQHIPSPVFVEQGDVISMYYQKSNFLAEAMVNGKDEQKNTHVGVVKSFENEVYDIPRGETQSPVDYLRQKLGLKNTDSMYVNQYAAEIDGTVTPLVIKDGNFYTTDGSPMNAVPSKITVIRPQLAHMIHYGNEQSPLHVEPLDKTMDGSDMSLYAVTRASEGIRDQIAEANAQIDTVAVQPSLATCKVPPCSALPATGRAKFRGVDDQVIQGIDHFDTQGIPQSQQEPFKAAVLATVEMESGGYKGYRNKAEFLLASVIGKKEDQSLGTYSQIKPSALEEAAKVTGDDVRGIDLTTDTGSIEGTGVIIKAIFQKYIPPTKKELSDKDLQLIGAAFNTGINSEYTRKLAKGDYTNLPIINAQSAPGIFSRKWFKYVRGYNTDGYFNAYPQRYQEAFRNYCCS